jgi:hypothetical protein
MTESFAAGVLKLPEEKFRELARYFSRRSVNCDCEVLHTIARTLRPDEWSWVESQCYSDREITEEDL